MKARQVAVMGVINYMPGTTDRLPSEQVITMAGMRKILLGRVPSSPSFYAPGSVEEGRYSVFEIGDAWKDTPGALE